MTIEQIAADLRAHMDRSEQHYQEMKEHKMSEPTHIKNIFEPGAGGAMGMLPYMGGLGGAGAGAGAGLGAGLLGGVLGGALLGGRGLFGGREGGENCVTPANLTAALAGVQDTQMNTAVLQGIGDLKTAVPVAEGQVQLALAQATGQLSNQINTNLVSSTQGFANTNQAIATATAGIIAVGETVKDTVNATSAATQLGIANLATSGLQNTFALSQAIVADGEKTRAILIAQNDANLQRQLAVAEAALLETRAEGRARGTEVNVTQTVNQAQAQAQAQQQQQQQVLLLNHLCTVVAGLQNAVATNSNMIIGNTGAVGTGPQTANPVNVRT